MERISLCGVWQGACIPVYDTPFEFSASVPGCAINDLINAGRLPGDIFRGKNADAVREYESCAFTFRRVFESHPEGRECLITFERLDTYCDVWLNGAHIGHRENGNISHTFDITGMLADGENTLEVRFLSPLLQVQGKKPRSGAFTTERLHTRRMQCTYGWDWVARFLTCGISGEVTLEMRAAHCAAVEDVYIHTRHVDSDGANVEIDVNFRAINPGRVLNFEIISPDGTSAARVRRFCAESFLRFNVDIPSPELWYPAGYGPQPVYELVVRDGDKELHREKFGIRTVRILQLPDSPGSAEYEKCLSIKNPEYDLNDAFSGFILKVNGIKTMCKGANWVPCEPFETGTSAPKVTRTLILARDAGVNMLRVWGGGRFETRHFYDECSRLGIMVTQDFLMACGDYPEDEDWFIAQLRQEAAYAARLMRNQPCLMWWSGDNENAVNGCDTDERYMGRLSAYRGIAPVLWAMDPHRDFLPSSPFGGNKYASNTVGTTHNTQFLGQFLPWIMGDGDLSDYKEKMKTLRARFIAEEPQLGAVCLETLRTFMTDDEIFGDDDHMWLYHTKTNPGLPHELFEYMATFARKLFGGFRDGHDRFFKFEYLQYEWLRVSMEQARREKWFCSGVIYWMLNDCWPAAAGWALIDFYNRPKAAWYAFKRTAAPLMASVDNEDGILRVYAVNDSTSVLSVKGTLTRINPDGTAGAVLADLEGEVPAGASVCMASVSAESVCGGIAVIDIESACGKTARSFWREGGLPLERADVRWEYSDGAYTVSADKYIHAVELPCSFMPEDNFFPLMPGEKRTVRCLTPGEEDKTVIAYTVKS